jgi:hypothetical protein
MITTISLRVSAPRWRNRRREFCRFVAKRLGAKEFGYDELEYEELGREEDEAVMSMCMYIARGPEAQLRELAEDAESLCGLPSGAAGVSAGVSAALGGTSEKLALIERLVAQRPDLRAAVGDFLSRAAPHLANPFAGSTAAAGTSAAVPMLGTAALLAGLGGSGGRGGMSGATPPRPAPVRPPIVDLHKSWHMFHFLFTGRAEGGTPPASLLMEGGDEIGEDLGYGAPRLLDPAATAALAGFVGPLTVAELAGRLDGERMAALGIYPGFTAADAVEEYGDDLEHYFPMLRDHLAAAAAAGETTLVWLS